MKLFAVIAGRYFIKLPIIGLKVCFLNKILIVYFELSIYIVNLSVVKIMYRTVYIALNQINKKINVSNLARSISLKFLIVLKANLTAGKPISFVCNFFFQENDRFPRKITYF